MENILRYALVGVFAMIFACNVIDEELDNVLPEEVFENLTDSCSYTIDNIIYNCNKVGTVYHGGECPG